MRGPTTSSCTTRDQASARVGRVVGDLLVGDDSREAARLHQIPAHRRQAASWGGRRRLLDSPLTPDQRRSCATSQPAAFVADQRIAVLIGGTARQSHLALRLPAHHPQWRCGRFFNVVDCVNPRDRAPSGKQGARRLLPARLSSCSTDSATFPSCRQSAATLSTL